MDMKTPNIVPGEASESDDDGEMINGKIIVIQSGPDAPPPISISSSATLQREPSISYGEEAVDESAVSETDLHQQQLRRMVNERCVSILNEFIHTVASSVSKQLTETDSLLMKSQVILQTTTGTVRKINESTKQLSSKLHDVLLLIFIPKTNSVSYRSENMNKKL